MDKSKVNTETLRAAHSTLGCKFDSKIGDTAHFRGAGLRKGIGTIIDIDGNTCKIGHSGTRVSTINDQLLSPPTTTTRSKHRLKEALSPKLKTIKPKSIYKEKLNVSSNTL